MELFKRKTIKNIINRSGKALHNGQLSRITLKPGNNGIVFYNIKRDKKKKFPLKINPFIVTSTSFATTIGKNPHINTVEHLLSALHALHITDLEVEVDGDELPIFDGSSYYYIQMIREAGILELDDYIEPIKINFPIWYIENDVYIIGLPSDKFEITYSIDFTQKSKILGAQNAHLIINEENYIKEISRARTFGFLEDFNAMKKKNHALGGSLENVLVYSKKSILNEEIRFNNEAVRHKMLDMIGDLYTTGIPIIGHIIAHKAGHTSDIAFAKKLYLVRNIEITSRKLHKIEHKFEEILKNLHISELINHY